MAASQAGSQGIIAALTDSLPRTWAALVLSFPIMGLFMIGTFPAATMATFVASDTVPLPGERAGRHKTLGYGLDPAARKS